MASKIWDNSGSFTSASVVVATSQEHRIPMATENENKYITARELLSGASASIAAVDQKFLVASASFDNRINTVSSSLISVSESINYTLGQVSESLIQSIAAVEVPIGSVVMFAGATEPDRYIPCDGRPLQRVDEPLLFAVIGTTWGSTSDNNFFVPNFNGRAPVGPGIRENGTKTWVAGEKFGEETHILSLQEMPAHDHTVVTKASLMLQTGETTLCWAGEVGGTTGMAGGNLPHNTVQPSLGILFIIRAR